ncbi:MAG: hypothetical protein IKH26_06015 [Bacteroidaceae bacterium]|nr:hypothetical protein [Bacteroidaceae bacterium]
MFKNKCHNEPTHHCRLSVRMVVWAGVLAFLTFTSCHRKIYDGSDVSQQTPTDMKKEIVFISAVMTRDTINGTYSMTEGKVELLPGRLKTTESAVSEETKSGFTYEKRNQRGDVLSEHGMDNPFVIEVETVGEDGILKRVVTQRDKASLFMRVRHVEGLAAIAIKHNHQVIGVIHLEDQ